MWTSSLLEKSLQKEFNLYLKYEYGLWKLSLWEKSLQMEFTLFFYMQKDFNFFLKYNMWKFKIVTLRKVSAEGF